MAQSTRLPTDQEAIANDGFVETTPEGEAVGEDRWDSVSLLTYFCQRYCKRAMCKRDIDFTWQRYRTAEGDQFQMVVKLNCFEGTPSYAGQLSTNQKEARQNAALQALRAYRDEFVRLPTIEYEALYSRL